MAKPRYSAFVDWDDTLKVTNALYTMASKENALQVIKSLAAPRITAENLIRLVHELDLARAEKEGLRQDNYPKAWEEGYRQVALMHGIKPKEEIIAAVRRRAESVLTTPQEDYPGARALIDYLRQHDFEITIWTAGVDEIQRARIERSGYHRLVDRIYVVSEKNATRLQQALDFRHPEATVVIGNSPRSDVTPALQLGVWTVHVQQSTWEYDQAELDANHAKYHGVDSLLHVPNILESIFPLAAAS